MMHACMLFIHICIYIIWYQNSFKSSFRVQRNGTKRTSDRTGGCMYVALKFQIIHTHLNRLEDDMMITFKALEGPNLLRITQKVTVEEKDAES